MTASRSWKAWSCTVRLTVDDPTVLGAASGALKALMDRVDKAASRFRPDSELSAINTRAGSMVPVSRLLVDLVDVSLVAASMSGGAVDPTVGGAVVAAGYDDDIEAVRRRLPQASGSTGPVPGWQQVQLNRRLALIGIPKDTTLDLGATAKAWTADRAALVLSKRHGCAVLVEIGGDLRAAGTPAEPWVIEVAEREGDPGVAVTLAHGGLTTSTRTARRWSTPGGFAHHVIDPRTGRPADGPWRTASVWAPSAVRANTFSTALVATGDAALGRLTLAGHPARLVDEDGEVTELAGWPAASRAA
ncbi:thiamine biosynthesis lipoprotein [Kribbella orskensis]|uniref:FAD:protein FMN transferase n=1 Tax=Kribbella orskensis TaxID=2512216 RepID=A0ABY2BUE9_9ACTN|nr:MULTISPECIES: FAD:protein FMN transferase [Kribbella]TCN44382.1 thiamine biosynthesis lipoprotein [Kribbella sp. VKM Ac-2500]TCO31840.1 thiamine biosynthesis lipoprotein [Kribbella orskensis]